MPEHAKTPCTLSLFEGDAIANLLAAYRLRGVDLLECDGRRALAVATHEREHELEDEQRRQREARSRSWLQRLTPWTEGPNTD